MVYIGSLCYCVTCCQSDSPFVDCISRMIAYRVHMLEKLIFVWVMSILVLFITIPSKENVFLCTMICKLLFYMCVRVIRYMVVCCATMCQSMVQKFLSICGVVMLCMLFSFCQ